MPLLASSTQGVGAGVAAVASLGELEAALEQITPAGVTELRASCLALIERLCDEQEERATP
jgi:hypothetical protein